MLKNKALWKGLVSVFCFFLSLSIILGGVLEANAGTIDTYLGTKTTVTVLGDGDSAYEYFTPDEQFLNEDGTGNSEALIQAAIDLGRKESQEGSVLLKNENNALPLAEGSNVTLLGIRSHVNLIGSSFGVKAQGFYISLEQALASNETDFANTVATTMGSKYGSASGPTVSTPWTGSEFEFDGAGFNLNQTMIDIYETLQQTEEFAHMNNEGAVEAFDPKEPGVADLAGVNADYKSSFAQYGDAAIVVIARPSGESTDYMPGGVTRDESGNSTTGAEEPLELTTNELEIIELAKEASDKVIVLINSSASIEIKELKDDPEVDAILWIGSVGNYGNLGVADILCGKVSPSGGLFDIFTSQNMSAPAMQNFGYSYFTNTAEVVNRAGGRLGFQPGAYTVEAEGIYVGYRYYETRYADAVAGVHNADSTVGAYESEGGWSYHDEVTYGFGYGLSYTDFAFEIGEPEVSATTNANGATEVYYTFNVKVTNTGSVAGKTSVQIYAQAPYYENGVEKAAIQLLNYEKTDVIQPGETVTVPVKCDLQYLASYDMNYENADGTKGTYIMDEGDYYFAVGNGAHDALNAILGVQGYTVEDGMDYVGDAAQVCHKNITEKDISKTAFSVAKTGEYISNELDYSDLNYYQPGTVVTLSRMDWEATWPKNYSNAITVTSDLLIDHLNGKYYDAAENVSTEEVIWGAESDLMIWDMWGKDYDDPAWEELLNKLTLEEAMYIFTFGGPSIPGADSIGAVEVYMTENAGNGVAVNLASSKTPEAPWAIGEDDPNWNWHPEVFGSACVKASSFSPELNYELGWFTGQESLFCGINILWGPGMNTHRHAYNGRNGEYYSEDPMVTGVCGLEFAMGALESGLVAAPKHFAFNDQETDRGGVSPFMTEQRAREVELRAFQVAFEATKYDTETFDAGMRGLMTSFSKIGGVEVTCSVGLMTNILIKEWNFIGYAVTDIYDDTDLWREVLNSGTTCFDTRGESGFYHTKTLENSMFGNQMNSDGLTANLIDDDLNLQAKLKDAVHKNLYSWTVSHVMNRYVGPITIQWNWTWWRAIYYGIMGVSAVGMIGCAALYVMSLKRKESEVK